MHSFRCLSHIWRYNPIVGLYGSMNDAITALFIRWLLQETCNFISLLWSKQKVWVGLLAATFSNRIPLYDLCDTVWVCCALFKNKVLTTTCLWDYNKLNSHAARFNFWDLLYCTQLSNLWWMPNSVSKCFGTAMRTGSSRRFKRYPTTYMWVSSWFPFTVD